jgi:hypothetical protein
MTKTCTKCGIEKETTDFYVHPDRRPRKSGKAGPTGFSSWCRKCYCEKTADWNLKFRTDARDKAWADAVKAKKQRVKDAVFGAYGGYVCACCGETEPLFMSIDHINNDGAKWRKETLGSRMATGWQTYRWLFKNSFPEGYQVLCMNCNFGKRMNGGVCPHQTGATTRTEMSVGSSDPKRTPSVNRVH